MDVSIIPCTAEATTCIIRWKQREISIQTNSGACLTFPFERCCLMATWRQRSPSRPEAIVRRAVLRVHGYNQWYYTLAPECSYHDEAAIDRLTQQLQQCRVATIAQVNPLSVTRPAVNIQPDFFWSAMQTLDPISPVPTSNIIDIKAFWRKAINQLAGYCTEPRKFIEDFVEPLSYRIHGHHPNWGEEPIFLRMILTHRHGHNNGNHLSPTGALQAAQMRTLVLKLTRGYYSIRGVLSSTSPECDQFSDMLWATHSSVDIKRIRSSALTEKIFGYPYEYDESALPIALDVIEACIQKEAIAMEDARSIFSGALRGYGPLGCFPLLFSNITDYHDDNTVMATHRFPVLPETLPKTIAGVFIGNTPAIAPISKSFPSFLLYTGHANILRFQIFEEMGFPRHFWRFVHLPHSSLMPVGLHYTGRPSIIIADAAYTLNNAPTLTFTPALYGIPAEPLKAKLLTDPVSHVSTIHLHLSYQQMKLFHEQCWAGRNVFPGVKFNAPKPDVKMNRKHIVLIRSGHHAVRDGQDLGLTDLGRQQLRDAAEWLAQLFNSDKFYSVPSKWAVAGLMSQVLNLEASISESIITFKKSFNDKYNNGMQDSSLFESEAEVYPEKLFTAAERSGDTLNFVISDDYHLLKYFGACFGTEPTTLRYCFWPHAGFLWITVSPNGWACLPTFGMVSHMSPELLTYVNAAIKVEGDTIENSLPDSVIYAALPKTVDVTSGQEWHKPVVAEKPPSPEIPALDPDENTDYNQSESEDDENTNGSMVPSSDGFRDVIGVVRVSDGEGHWETTSDGSRAPVIARKISWISGPLDDEFAPSTSAAVDLPIGLRGNSQLQSDATEPRQCGRIEELRASEGQLWSGDTELPSSGSSGGELLSGGVARKGDRVGSGISSSSSYVSGKQVDYSADFPDNRRDGFGGYLDTMRDDSSSSHSLTANNREKDRAVSGDYLSRPGDERRITLESPTNSPGGSMHRYSWEESIGASDSLIGDRACGYSVPLENIVISPISRETLERQGSAGAWTFKKLATPPRNKNSRSSSLASSSSSHQYASSTVSSIQRGNYKSHIRPR